jgi:hypothetical protein
VLTGCLIVRKTHFTACDTPHTKPLASKERPRYIEA